LDAGHHGYYYDWNPHIGGWCRMVVDAALQSQSMATSSSWVDLASSHVCVRKSASRSLDDCLQSGLCKMLPTRSQIRNLDKEGMACRNGWETNFHLILGDPPLVGGGITETQCKQLALKQGYFGYYFDWGFHGGWCRFVLDAEKQGEKMQTSISSWTDWPTSHTCVLMSKSNHLQSCINSQQCYTGTTKIFPSVPTPPVTLSSSSQADLPAHNVASQSAGAIPFGSSSLPGFCSQTGAGQGVAPSTGIHCWQNINDGKLGNSHSWIPGAANAFVGVVFANSVEIQGIRVSRKGAGDCCNDRIGGTYVVEYTNEMSAGLATTQWIPAGSFTRNDFGFLFFKFSSAITATAIRITVSDAGACIDELEAYSATGRRLADGFMV